MYLSLHAVVVTGGGGGARFLPGLARILGKYKVEVRHLVLAKIVLIMGLFFVRQPIVNRYSVAWFERYPTLFFLKDGSKLTKDILPGRHF